MTGRVVAVIPARYASVRFPAKPLALIAGTPMVVRVLENMRAAKRVDDVLVATDDERIADVVRAAGGSAVLTDPSLPSGSDRVWAAVAGRDADLIVNVQGDEPLLHGEVVDALIERLDHDGRADIATPAVVVPRITASAPDVVTIACAGDLSALYFSRSVIPHGVDPVRRHIGVYAYRRTALERFVATPPTALERAESLEQLRALDLGMRIAVVEVQSSTHAVDRPSDIAVVERLLSATTVGKPIAARVSGVILDVDGVLTDGRITYDADGQVISFDVKDGHGIVELLKAGIVVAVLSSRDSPALQRRAAELGIAFVRAGVADKKVALAELSEDIAVPMGELCYVGDDAVDLPAMELCGLTAAPADASPIVLGRVDVRLTHDGGRGAVRELADLLLDARRSSSLTD